MSECKLAELMLRKLTCKKVHYSATKILGMVSEINNATHFLFKKLHRGKFFITVCFSKTKQCNKLLMVTTTLLVRYPQWPYCCCGFGKIQS